MTKTQMQLEQLLAGVQKDLPATSTVDIDGQETKQSDIVAKLQGWIQLYEQKDGAKGTASSTVKALKTAGITQWRVSFGEALKQVFGKSSPLLGDFGLATTQRKTPSTQTKILAQAKTKATRAARKTMGSVQKQAVKGAGVTSVTVSPNAEPSVVSAGSQPVVAAASTGPAEPEAASAAIPVPAVGSVPIGGGGK